MAWYYWLLLLLLLAGSIYLCVLINQENSKLDSLEQQIDATTAEQQQAREDYESVMAEASLNLVHGSHLLPIRRAAAPGSLPRFTRSCQCFSHSHRIKQDYHLHSWEVVESHSLTPQQTRRVASNLPRASAQLLVEQASQIQPLRKVRVFKVAEFARHDDVHDPDDPSDTEPLPEDYGYCSEADNFQSHSCDDMPGGETFELLWQWSAKNVGERIEMVGPEDEAADKARQETIGPDVEGEAAAQAAYAAEMRRQVRAQGKIYELEPDYGLLLRAHTTYHFVVSIDYAMNYTENENLIEAAYSVTGNEQPWDASGKPRHSVPAETSRLGAARS